jgi:uncharacterized protein YodC (DUF2158 family)
MSPLKKLRIRLFGPVAHFKRGDTVQLEEGGYLLNVIEVITDRGLPEPIINCKWYEPETKAIRTNIFRESRLRHFNWYAAANH